MACIEPLPATYIHTYILLIIDFERKKPMPQKGCAFEQRQSKVRLRSSTVVRCVDM